ncbi:sigma-54-dependent transcriptional regulator [Pseudomonas sp. DC3000-4b1]|uniref:sigma-54-dependent transcriptional regulator n=1 Tax=unclassified Pseudomonas TaxID=196821 RepID=UPI003CF9DC5A
MMSSLPVLVIEDDPHVLLGCQQALALEDIHSEGVASAEAALARVEAGFPGVVISDIRLPGMDGLALLSHLRTLDPALPVILITGHGDIALAVSAMRQGAYDFMEKPFSPERLVDVVRRALTQRSLTMEVQALRRQLAGRGLLEERLLGQSRAMQVLRDTLRNVADTPANVLIIGETGTGKELVARCLHDFSRRQPQPFVALNCGALPDSEFHYEIFGHEAHAFSGADAQRIGKIEYAQGGTLFLDEVQSLPEPMQVKMLRVLQERTLERLGSNSPLPVDIRVIAATKSLGAVETPPAGMRSDFFYRLNVVTLLVPPLRDRRDDILDLFEHFLAIASARFDRPLPALDSTTRARLLSHPWPGNVRELRNVAERFALGLTPFGDSSVEHARPTFNEAVEVFERGLLLEALARTGGNLSQASQELGLAKTTLFDKVRKYRLTGQPG